MQEPDSWTVVHHLQSQAGGILDSDDRVSDVADDRELIIATFEDSPDPGVPQGGGDGASGSSVGTGSPDIFYGPNDQKFGVAHETNDDATTNHIEVTGTNQPNAGLGLQVRRSSDPSLHQLVAIEVSPSSSNAATSSNSKQYNDPTKRWSAAPVCRNDTDQPDRLYADNEKRQNIGHLSPAWESEHEEHQSESIPSQLSRSGRLSMQFLGDGNGYKWIDAAEKAASSYNSKSLPRETKRKEPLGQAYESMREKNSKMLLITNEFRAPLGLTAIPDMENGGVLVQHVEKDSPAERGQLQRGDRIFEINGVKLIGMSATNIQDYLRRNCQAPELRLRVIKTANLIQTLKKEIDDMVEAEEKLPPTKSETNTSPRKVPGATSASTLTLQTANTRKIGRKIEIVLCKGPQGLGFSVTTRDNQAGGDCPIYIKKILSLGAAIENGRLRPGDRLLEVDGVTMTGKSQSEVVEFLRATKPGATVRLVVSRQQDLSELSDDREVSVDSSLFVSNFLF